jgi:hypothetical protein
MAYLKPKSEGMKSEGTIACQQSSGRTAAFPSYRAPCPSSSGTISHGLGSGARGENHGPFGLMKTFVRAGSWPPSAGIGQAGDFRADQSRLGALPPETKALVRSMLTAPEAAASMSALLNERVANLSRAMGGEDAGLRAALIVSPGVARITCTRARPCAPAV